MCEQPNNETLDWDESELHPRLRYQEAELDPSDTRCPQGIDSILRDLEEEESQTQ